MSFAEVEKGVSLYYEDYGAGQPLVFVHGGGMSHEMWEQQVYALTEENRTIAYDLRGHGQSDKPPAGHTFDRLVLDLDALLRQRGVERLHLVCHGIGGYVGLLFALAHPGRVRGLALVSSGARFVGADAERGGFSTELWSTYTSGMARNKIEATAHLVNTTFFHRDPGAATRQAVIDIMLQWPLYAMKMLGRDLEKVDLESRLSGVRVPALVLHGVHDRKQRYSGAAHLASQLSGARLVAFEDSAHNPQLEEVEKFNRVLAEFVRETAGPDA
jgi:non-heme chloroperoxidase